MHLLVPKLNLNIFTQAPQQKLPPGSYDDPQTEGKYSIPSRQHVFQNLSPTVESGSEKKL